MQADLDNIDQQLTALDAGFDRGDLNSPTQREHLASLRQSNTSLGTVRPS